jgi:hypothetical protein
MPDKGDFCVGLYHVDNGHDCESTCRSCNYKLGFLQNGKWVSCTLERFNADKCHSQTRTPTFNGISRASIRRTAGLVAPPTLHQPARPLSTLPTLHLPPVSARRTKIPCWRAVVQRLCSGSNVREGWLGEQCFHNAGGRHFGRVGLEERVVIEGGVDREECYGSTD